MAGVQGSRASSAVAACFVLACAGLIASASAYITIQSGDFVDENCRVFNFNGYNTWQILENAAGVVGSKSDVDSQFDAAVKTGFNAVRIFGFGTESGFALQTSIGQYNPAAWDAFDYVIAAAKQRKLRLIVALADNWDTASNTDNKYFYTGGSSSNEDSFFTSSSAQTAYQNHLTEVVNHVNSITGNAYKNEPTIASWNLINEPRCANSDCAAAMQAWIAKMAPFLKQQDPNHLVTVGEDGFYNYLQCNADVNPGGWAGQTGQNFLPNHALPGIDYAAIHLWPDNWAQYDIDFARYWISNHSANAKTLQRPLLLEEFGKAVNSSVPQQNEFQRQAFYKLIYSLVESSIDDGGPLKGILFWRWDQVMNVDLGTTGSPGTDADTLDSNAPAFTGTIVPFTQRINGAKAQTVSGCTPGAAPAPSGSATAYAPSVSVASIGSSTSGPDPSDFDPPNLSDIPSSCNALMGRLVGTVVANSTQPTADACCAACNSNSRCTVWNYCFCDGGCGGGTIAKGTCELRNQPNAFYPRADVTNGAGFLAGSPKVSNITFPWECQPDGNGCTPQTVGTCSASALESSLVCPSGACNASQVNVGGDVITIDGCDDGCESYVSTAAAGTANPPFGSKGGCQGNAFPFNQCTLKTQSGGFQNATVYDSGSNQPWVSGSGSTASSS
ncbi:hypothetical protein WJX73_008718 [Symbiochloris irregularis]|uniref:mannan endo-1,4-beta-mannosidase n=1 Tax=Symbiochloris irregularis TaxID=706552 RepID=A0AAW1NN01_9CHLO